MAPKDVYRDDAALTKLLDNLITSAQEDASEATTASDLTRSPVDVVITHKNLAEGLIMANSQLQNTEICTPLPDLGERNANLDTVLAAALTAIIRLARCCQANVNLRAAAEGDTRTVKASNDQLSNRLETSQARLAKRDVQVCALQNATEEATVRHKRSFQRLQLEISELKGRLVSAGHRENHQNLEARKRERDYTQLQQRVLTLMASTKRVSIEPTVTTTGRGCSSVLKKEVSVHSSEGDWNQLAEDSAKEASNQLEAENDVLRSLLLAVQEELDELLVKNPGLFPVTDIEEEDEHLSFDAKPHDDTLDNSTTEEDGLEDEEGTHLKYGVDCQQTDILEGQLDSSCEKWAEEKENQSQDGNIKQQAGKDNGKSRMTGLDGVLPAPSAEQMSLPFDMIREEFEEALQQKFSLVREALSRFDGVIA